MKVIALATAAAALSIAGGASAHGGQGGHGDHRATVYGATLAKTSAADPAYAEVAGRAHLVDGRKHNPLVVHVRHLKPGAPYTFELSSAPCDQTATPVSDFQTTSATANEDGDLSGKADSNTFQAGTSATYSVVVKDGPTAIACGELKAKHTHHAHKQWHKDAHDTFELEKHHKDPPRHQGDDRR